MKGSIRFLFIVFLSILTCSSLAQLPYRLSVSLSKMVDLKTLAPGNFNDFQDFRALALNERGAFVFVGDAKPTFKGVYSNLTGPLSIIADKDTLIPGTKNKKFYNFSSGDSLAFLGDQIAFLGNAYYQSPTLYKYDQGRLLKIADFSTKIPNSVRTFTGFADPKFDPEDGAVFFLGRDSNNHVGIYRYSPQGKLTTLIPAYAPIPGTSDHFTRITNCDVTNTDHDIAFVGGGDNGQNGLYLWHQGKITKLVDKSVMIPNGVGYFDDIGKIDFTDNGQVAFIGMGVLGQTGLYLYNGHKVIKLVDQKTALPQTTGFFGTIYKVIVTHGYIVFCGSDYHEDGVYLYSPQGVFKIISTRDAIDDKGISKLSLGQGFDGQHLGVIVTFDNGDQAIYILTIKLTN